MQYKLVAVDMDGTLLNNQGIITEKTKDAIRRAVDKGVIFTVSTGRPIQGVERYSSDLPLDAPFITYNGAMIIKGKSKEVLYEQSLSAKDARNVLDWAKKFGTTYIIWSNNCMYANEINERVQDYKKLSLVEPIQIENDEEIIQTGATKILWYDEIENIERYQREMNGKLRDGISYYTSKPNFLEFVDKRVSKAVAMERLGSYYGITAQEMIAIGDGNNDLSMIEYAGLGVAMANAPDSVKEKADYITLSNEEDGIAHVLDKFIL